MRSREARQILENHMTRVYRFALRLTSNATAAEDLTQDTMLRAWRHRRKIRDPDTAHIWLFRIAANLQRDAVRKAGRRAPSMPQPPLDPRSLEQTENVHSALDALQDLPPRQREVLYLAACEDLTPKQIADILDITPDAAKASLSLARTTMRERFAEPTSAEPVQP